MPATPDQKSSQPKLSQFFFKKATPQQETSTAKSSPSSSARTPNVTPNKNNEPKLDCEGTGKKLLATTSSTPARKKARPDATIEHVDSPVSDEDYCVSRRKNSRRKGQKASLRESSSESEESSEEENNRKENRRKASVMKSITAVLPETQDTDMAVEDTTSTPPVEPNQATPPTKAKLNGVRASDARPSPEAPPAKGNSKIVPAGSAKPSAEAKGEEKRHADFVRKVGLLRHTQEHSGLIEAAHTREERLEPCALTVPKGAKLTPFEEQVVAIKRSHPSTVLFVECGYKFRFLGRDAEIAAKVLNIFHHMDHNFLSASIPTFRLQVHLRRMVEAGYKVGVVRQMETAALKAVSTNKSKAFERSLCEVYTKATIPVEDVDILGLQHSSSSNTAVYLLAVCEADHAAGAGSDGSVLMGMMAVDTASGDMVYDEWQDDNLRTELESRISQLQPKELLLPSALSSASQRLLLRYATAGSLRMETLSESLFNLSTAASSVRKWFRGKGGAPQEESSASFASSLGVDEVGCVGEGRVGADGVESVLKLPATVLACINALQHYLAQFNLQQVLRLTGNLWRFASGTHMVVEASVLENLEVLVTEKGDQGSLFWLLKATHTAFGARLLRHWITHPLLSLERIEARHEAVAELLTEPAAATHWEEIIKGLPDLERALARVQYRKCGPSELVALLASLSRLCARAKQGLPMAQSLESPLLRSLMTGFPDMSEALQGWLDAINSAAATAANPDKRSLLVGFDDPLLYPEISAIKADIAQVDKDLDDHLQHWRTTLRMHDLEYKTLLTTPYLIEIPVGQVGKVPKDWLKMSGTQKVARYHTPTIQDKYAQILRLQEKLDSLCTAAWQDFLASVAVRYAELRGMVQGMAVLDCLFSLARVAKRGGWVRPEMQRGAHAVDIVGGRHPMVEATIGDRYVPNDVRLSHDSQRAMVITGPNMGGKSSLIRQTALIVLMAQIGSFVPAERARLSVVDAIYTRMGARDAISQGRSTFLVEMQEASHILQHATARSLVIMDELGRGTSTHDGTAIAFATLRELVERIGSLTLFVTHYHLLCNLTAALPTQVGNYHVGFMAGEGDRVTFLYRLVSGSANRSFGLNVAVMAGLPASVVDRAREQALVMEGTVKDRIGAHVPRLFRRVAALAAAGATNPSADGEDGSAAERLAVLQEEARKALLLVGPAK